MRTLASLTLGALLLSTSAAQAAPRLQPEQQLAELTAGRVAGEPVDCINLRNIRSSRIIDNTAIVYEVGNTIYVNRPRAGATSLDSWDVLVTKTHSPQLCSIDVVQLYDTASRMQTGFVFLDAFVPYRRVR